MKMKWYDGEPRNAICSYCGKPEGASDPMRTVIRDGEVAAALHESCMIEVSAICKESRDLTEYEQIPVS